jgi:Kef-type K+ transport system membrane component KefB
MFSTGNNIVTIIAVLICLALVMSSIYFVNKMFANDTQEILVKFILLVFTALVAIYVIDKIVAFKINVLSQDEDRELFDLIKTLILMIFSYYFGTKKSVQ